MIDPIILQGLFRVIDGPTEKITVTLYNEKDEPLITFILPGWEFLNDFVIDDIVMNISFPAANKINIKVNTEDDPEIIDPGDYFQPQIIINGKKLEDWLVDFVGATALKPGVTGLVPAPKQGDQTKYLRGDGTWSPVSGGGGGASEASEVHYDHSVSGLTATDLQMATDELAEKKLDKAKLDVKTEAVGSASNWNAGVMPVFKIEEDGILKIILGKIPTLNVTTKTVVKSITTD